MSQARVPDHLWTHNTDPPELRDVLSRVSDVLQDLGYNKARRALHKEALAHDVALYEGDIEYAPGDKLLDMWPTNSPTLPSMVVEGSTSSDSEDSDAEAGAPLTNVGNKTTGGDLEDSSSSSDSGSSAKAGQKRKREASSDSSDDSSSDSSSDSGSESGAMKDDTSSSNGSDSDSESSSSEESDKRPSKRVRVSKEEKGSASDSSSDSDSDSSSSSSGASDSKKAAAKSNKLSSSDSGSSSTSSSNSSSSNSDSSSNASSESSSDSSSDSSRNSDSGSSSSSSSASKKKKSKKSKKSKPNKLQNLPALHPPNIDRTGSASSSSATLAAVSPIQPRPKDAKATDTLLVQDANAGTTSMPATKENIKKLKKDHVQFSRIPADTKVDPRFSSNAYVPYDYAENAYRDLSKTQGKGFTKEKNKKKRGKSSSKPLPGTAGFQEAQAFNLDEGGPDHSRDPSNELLDDFSDNPYGFKEDTWAFMSGCGFDPLGGGFGGW